jgi:hypothetical protein
LAPAVSSDLTFHDWHRETEGQPGWARREGFRFLPSHVQDAGWDDLRRRVQKQHEADWEAEKWLLYEPWPPPKRRRPHQGTPQSTSTGTDRVQFETHDPLKRIPAIRYLPAIAHVDVSSSGRCRCPRPDHPDEHPSAKAYGTLWRCFSCGAGRTIIDVAEAVYGIPPPGVITGGCVT